MRWPLLKHNGFEVTESGTFDPNDPTLSLDFPEGSIDGRKGVETISVRTSELPTGGIVRRVEYRRDSREMTIEEMRRLVGERYSSFGSFNQPGWGLDSRDAEAQEKARRQGTPYQNRFPVLQSHFNSYGIMLILEDGQILRDQIADELRKFRATQTERGTVSF